MDFLEFRFTSRLSEISLKTLLMTALWMALAYGPWLILREIHGDHGYWALLPVLGFTPLALWALYDYRLGLMFAIVAAPLLTAPPIPHGFTQGFGDLFGICAVIGFLLRYPDPRKWRRLWRGEYVWLLLILVAAFLSLALSPVWQQEVRYGIKYSLAEIAGYTVAMAYLVVLVNELRDRLDIKVFLYAVAAAVLIVALFSLASLIWSMTCVGGYAARTALTVNGALTSTFANPNYQASYLVTVLPFALWFYLQAQPRSWPRYFAAAAILLLILFVQATISRGGFVGLVAIWIGWLAITRWKKGTRRMTVVISLMLPMTFTFWWYPTYNCYPFNYSNDSRPPIKIESGPSIKVESSKSISDSIHQIKFAASVTKGLGDGGVSVRIELARNAISAWRDHPITGVGIALLSNYSSVDGQINRAHNVMLTVLAEQGIIGLLVWTGWLGSLLAVFWRARRQVAECGHPSAFLLVAFMGAILQSMFMDYYRVIWVWQVGALVLAWGAIAFDRDKRRVAQ